MISTRGFWARLYAALFTSTDLSGQFRQPLERRTPISDGRSRLLCSVETTFRSDPSSETYAFLHQSPIFREWVGGVRKEAPLAAELRRAVAASQIRAGQLVRSLDGRDLSVDGIVNQGTLALPGPPHNFKVGSK